MKYVVRKLGGNTLRSISDIGKHQTIQDNNEAYVPPREMLRELMEDNKKMAAAMRKARWPKPSVMTPLSIEECDWSEA